MKLRFLLLPLLLLAIVSDGCKKGENDPFFSLRTRTNRLSGDWTVVSAELLTRTDQTTYDGALASVSPVDSAEVIRTFDLDWSLNFEADGAYEITEASAYPVDYFSTGSAAVTITRIEKGTWQFTGGNGSTKTKEQLLFLAEEVSVNRSDQGANLDVITYTNPIEGRIYDIDRLTVNELVLKYELVVAQAFGQYTESAEIKLEQ